MSKHSPDNGFGKGSDNKTDNQAEPQALAQGEADVHSFGSDSDSARSKRACDGFLRVSSLMNVGVGVDFFVGLKQAVAVSSEAGARALYRIGRCWGEAWFARLENYAHKYHDTGVQDLSIEELGQLVGQELERTGWGKSVMDLETFVDEGLMLVTISGGPSNALTDDLSEAVAMLLAGFFSGILSALAELPIEGVGLCTVEGSLAVTQVVMLHEAKVGIARSVWERSGGLMDVVSALRGARKAALSAT